jgi:hypothetical protein
MSRAKIKVTGLWKAKTKRGETYLSAKGGGNYYIQIMPNSYKEKDSDPDYIMYYVSADKNNEVDLEHEDEL